MKKVYYAHNQGLYGTMQEQRDISTLVDMGFEVSNPGDPAIIREVNCLPLDSNVRMAFFEKFADECDVVAFRALPDGSIPAGVAKEIAWFQDRHKPVLELPSGMTRRTLTVDQTREYLKEIGQR